MSDQLVPNPNSPQPIVPKWLQKIQETSWEAEILISFGALIALFKLPNYLILVGTSMEKTMGMGVFAAIPVFFNIPITILGMGFICHLIIRGFWAGMIAMNFSFPKGINKEKLNWKGRFEPVLQNIRSNTKVILDLEKLAGIVFGFTFLMFFSFLALIVWLMLIILLPTQLILTLQSGTINDTLKTIVVLAIFLTVLILLIVSLVYLIDFISFSWLKKHKRFSKVYYPFYKFISLITLSYFSKNLYYTLITNIKKRRILGGILGLLLILFLMVYFTEIDFSGRSKVSAKIRSYNPGKYGKLEDWDFNFRSSTRIDRKISENGYIQAFWLYDVNDEDSLKMFCYDQSIISDSSELESNSELAQQNCLDSYYNIYIDDSIKIEPKWDFFVYEEKILPFYIMTSMIDVTNLNVGPHTIAFIKGENKESTEDKIQFYVSGYK